MPEPVAIAPRPFRVSLQTKILAAALICVGVPMLSIGGYLFQRNEETLREKVFETVSNHLLRRENDLVDWLQERLRDLQLWSASFVVQEGVEALSRPGVDRSRIERDLRTYLEFVLGNYPTYESLFVVDLKGEVLAGTRDERLDPWAVEQLADVSTRGDGVFSPILRSEYLGRHTQLVLQSIKGPAGGRTVGVFVARLDLRELEALLASGDSDFTPALSLLDENRRVLLQSGKLVDALGEKALPGLPEEDLPEPGVAEATLPGLGRTVYGVRAYEVEGLRGFLVSSVPATVAYRALEESRRRLLNFGLPAILLILAVNVLAARGLLRPILLLSEGAKRVATGDLDVYLPVRGRDEIADLTRAFNEMTRRLREGRQSLEEARDELARTNEGLKAANRTLEALAITDGLTGLYNHRHFQESIEKEIRRCDREGRPLSLLLLDLDHFKQYNDRYGHTEGDAALRRVAGHVMKSIRATDMAFRYGGEELAVLLPSCSKEQAAEVAEKMREAVAKGGVRPGRFGGRTTISIGVATFPEDGRVARGLVDTADAALYTAKAQGRDRVAVAGQAPLLGQKSAG
jgi:diguanylate cyclase (GGDEF)-like protein